MFQTELKKISVYITRPRDEINILIYLWVLVFRSIDHIADLNVCFHIFPHFVSFYYLLET